MLCVYLHVLRAHEVILRKNNYLCGLCKLTNFHSKLNIFVTRFFA
jgi:hypothetical protein